jgi:hypothetical protein
MSTPRTRIASIALGALLALVAAIPAGAQGAFDEFGYNHDAMMFIGTGDSWDRTIDGTYNGDPTLANDRLTMRWNAEWARGMEESWSDPNGYAGAWLSNTWNGNVPGGSGELASYKFTWVEGCTTGERVDRAGTCIRDQFAMLVDSEGSSGEQLWTTYAALPIFGLT